MLKLWVLTSVGTVIADSQCRGQACLDANDGIDDSALLQVRHSNSVSELTTCVENFACGVVATKVGEDMNTGGDWGGITGMAGMVGGNFACHAEQKLINKYLDEKGLTAQKDEMKKAQPCIMSAQKSLVLSCAKIKLGQVEAKYKAVNLPMGASEKYKQNATFLRNCSDAYAAQKKNMTLQAKLYKGCGYPDIAKKMTTPPPKSSAGSALVGQLCELGGMFVTQLVNVLRTKMGAYKAAKLNEDLEQKSIDEEREADDEEMDRIDDEIKGDIDEQDEEFGDDDDDPADEAGDDIGDDIGEDIAEGIE